MLTKTIHLLQVTVVLSTVNSIVAFFALTKEAIKQDVHFKF